MINYWFLRDINEGYLSLKDADDEQTKFANKLKSINKGIKSIKKKLFLSNICWIKNLVPKLEKELELEQEVQGLQVLAFLS